MTEPMLDHAPWCSRPPIRSSADIFDRTRIRWRCPECSAFAYTRREAS